MPQERVTLTGEDAELFREIQEEIEEKRRGYSVTNVGTVRRLMENYVEDDSRR